MNNDESNFKRRTAGMFILSGTYKNGT